MNRAGAWVKIEPQRWRLRAILVWEAVNGKLPRGCVVHHKDHDGLNDTIENLTCLTRAQHLAEHRDEIMRNRSAYYTARRGQQ